MSDGTFTYAYNGAGRLVRAQSLTSTLVYTYTADGLRVAQSVESSESVFSWDWASGVSEMLSDGASVYLVGHDTLGGWDGVTWAYHLPDALGSVRQVADGAGSVVSSREWTPFGVELGVGQAGLGYTGEWWDASVGLQYLRARWYAPRVGRFTRRDPWPGTLYGPQSLDIYPYAANNPVLYADASGECPQCWLLALLGLALLSGCTGDFDCSDVEIAIDTTDVECKGLECSKKMVAAFWLPQGNQTAFRKKCAVIQWARGTVLDNRELVTCGGDDCIEMPAPDGSGRSFKMCPPGGNCQTLSSSYWHVDKFHFASSEYPLFDNTDVDGMSWERFGFELPEDVPEERAIYMQDTPTIRSEGPDHELKIDLEFAIAVYNRDDLGDLPTHGGDWGSPDEFPLPCNQKRWYFYKESYITQLD
ncbi:MAG: RHS repeat-associated core domain-containing protein [Chloroflexota bacterium]|nr:RHS repeat-associated core domain-containing protein [Chloroflexota bacterium]